MVKLQEELANVRQQLDTACEGRRAALQDLLLHTVGFYQAKSDRAWNSIAFKARYGHYSLNRCLQILHPAWNIRIVKHSAFARWQCEAFLAFAECMTFVPAGLWQPLAGLISTRISLRHAIVILGQ